MNRTLSLILGATLLLGCGNKESAPKTENKPTAEAPKEKPKATAAQPTKPVESAKKIEKTAKIEKTPEAKALPEAKQKPVPESWVWIDRKKKGYSFAVPEGSSEFESPETKKGAEVYAAYVPEPNNLEVYVFAFKDKSLSKEDLSTDAPAIIAELAAMPDTTLDAASIADEGDYRFANGAGSFEGKKFKIRYLIAIDKSDNYIMAVIGDEAGFDKDTETIDTILGSFYMWSGGASGDVAP